MFATPNPEALRDVEAQQRAPVTTVETQRYIVTKPEQPGSPAANPMQQMGSNPAMQQMGSNSNIVPGQQQQSQTQDKSIIAKMSRVFDWGAHQLLLSFFAFIVFVQSAQICDLSTNYICYGVRGFQVAVGVISFFIGLFCGILYYLGKFSSQIGQEIVSIFQFLWWVAGVIVLTYYGDYQTVLYANGYYGAWACLIFSILAMVSVSETFEYGMDKTAHTIRKPLFYLMIASLIVMLSSIGPCSPQDFCSGPRAFAVCLGVISLFIAFVLFFFPAKLERTSMKLVGWFLVFWWVIGALVVTFNGPFQRSGNGFFASYAAFFASVGFLHRLRQET